MSATISSIFDLMTGLKVTLIWPVSDRDSIVEFCKFCANQVCENNPGAAVR